MSQSLRESDANSANSASLKGKIQSIEDIIQTSLDDMSNHKKDVNSIRTERDSLQELLRLKVDDMRNNMTSDIGKIEEELSDHFGKQKGENSKLIMELNKLKNEKTELQKTLIGIVID